MTTPNQTPVRSALARGLLILPLGLALSAGHHSAQAQAAPSCTAALNQLMSQWQSIGFVEPGKPTQMIVPGRHGYSTTAGQFNFMRREINAGAQACEAGQDAVALQHINAVRAALDHTHAI